MSGITIKTVPNILSKHGRDVRMLDFDGTRIVDYLEGEHLDPMKWTVYSNRLGQIDESRYTEEYVVALGDELRLVATAQDPITVAIVSAVVIVGAAGLGAATATLLWLVGFAVSAVLQTALAKAFQKDVTSAGGHPFESSPTYGWQGIQTSMEPDIPVPIIYGTHLVGGNILNAYISNENEKSYLNLLLGLCEGTVNKIAGQSTDADAIASSTVGQNVIINGNPASNYEEVEFFTRMGNDVQATVPYFRDLHSLVEYSDQQLLKGERKVFTTLLKDVGKINVGFTAPRVIQFQDDGDIKTQTIKVKVEYKLHTSPTWITHGTFQIKDKTLSPVRADLEHSSIGAIDGLTPGEYDIGLTKTSANSDNERQVDIFLSFIDEIRHSELTYPNIALIGVRALATNQLAGGMPTVQVLVEGTKVRASEDDATPVFTNNPIWCLYDLMTNKRYGLGEYIDQDAINDFLPLYQEEADYADELVPIEGSTATEKRFELDIVLDSETGAPDLISHICSTFRCIPFWTSGAVRPVIEKPMVAVRDIGMGDIIAGSFQTSFTTIKQEINVFEIQFRNKDDKYNKDVVRVEDTEALLAGERLRKKVSFLPGIARASQCARIGRFSIWAPRYCPRVTSWKSSINAIDVQAGECVNLSHQLTGWAIYSGRVLSASDYGIAFTTNVELPELASGEYFIVRVAHADGTVEERNSWHENTTVIRGDELPIYPAWTNNPTDYDIVSIYKNTGALKKFRIIEIGRAQNDNGAVVVPVTAIEVNDDIYSDVAGVVTERQFSNLPDPRQPPPSVTDLATATGRFYDIYFDLSFAVPAPSSDTGLWDHAEIYISTDGETYRQLMTTTNRMTRITEVTPGQTYYVKVRSVSKWGVKENFDDAPVTTVIPMPRRPPNVSGLELKGMGNQTEFSTLNAEFTWRSIGANANFIDPILGAGGGSPDKFFAHYVVEIWTPGTGSIVSGDIAQRRNERVLDTFYTYDFNKNWEDHETALGIAVAREIQIRVWAVDIFNQRSLQPAILTVSNSEPGAIVSPTLVDDHTGSSLEDAPIVVVRYGTSNRTRIYWNLSRAQDHAGYILKAVQKPLYGTNEFYMYQGTNNFFELSPEFPYTQYDFYIGDYDTFDDTIGVWAGPAPTLVKGSA